MKTLYLTNSSANIAVDFEENNVCTLNTEDRYDIRHIFYIEEPTHVVFEGSYDGNLRHEEIDAKKGDILLVFYLNRYSKKILATVKSKEWAANIKNRRAVEQKEKEEWASKNIADCSTPCCDKCECAG